MLKLMMVILAFSINAQADIGFSNITQSEMESIVNEFSADFAPTTVSSAAPLGKIFGVEIGVIGGATKAPSIETYAERATGKDAPGQLPHAAIFAAVSLPFGLTAELGGIPKVKMEGGDFKYGFGSLKWTFWDTLADVAVKLSVAKLGFSFTQSSGGVDGTVDFDDTVETLVLMASKNFIFIEPYFGIGTIKTNGTLKVTGTGTVFDTTYTTAQEANQSPSGAYSVLGANVNLFILKLGLEFYKTLGTQGASAKLSFYF